MKTRNREINIFNLSMLDVIAGAMGAFLILMVILFPYFKKNAQFLADIQRLKEQITQQSTQIEQQKQELEQAKQENAKLKEEIDNAIQFALLGITTKARSFVVLIDLSGSMKAYGDPMLRTMDQLIAPMKDQNRWQIVGYQGGSGGAQLHRWQAAPQMASMTGSSKIQAHQFVAGLVQKFDGGTPTHDALVESLQYDAEAIILITDGAPDGNAGDIVRDITSRNAGKREIHCVALGDYRSKPELTAFLEALATANGGGFLGVAN
jgi:outer membrane murein-binding lipoprotein Lpp